MKKMIDELWYGNVSPMDDTRNNTEEMKELMSYITRHQEELMATLTDEQKAIFEKFDDCLSEYSSKAEKVIFSYAFKLGARLMLETLIEQ